MPKKPTITAATAEAILDAAWALILNEGKPNAGMAEIARAAGVTRQSAYLAFGSRAGLLIAMARRADARSAHSHRMAEIAADPAPTPATFLAFVEAWLRHLPEIFPVGRYLIAAAVTDPDAALVLRDRMEGSLLAKYRSLLTPLAAQKRLRPGIDAEGAADLAWSFTHLDAWRQLVVERGWSPEDFRQNRVEVIRRTLLRDQGGRD